MKKKHLSSMLILTAAMLVAAYVVYEHRSDRAGYDPLDEYLETEGIDVIERGEVSDLDSNEFERVNETGVKPGMLLKDVSLPTWEDDEREISVADFRGEYVVLNIWASWCRYCRKEMPDFVQFQEDYGDEGVQVVGINRTFQEGSEENVDRFIEEFNINFPTLMEYSDQLSLDYQVIALPLTYILDPDGRIITRTQGYMDYDMLEEFLEEAKYLYEESDDTA
ncbi:TlpA disulfide reductase family protein [Alteribacter aurantiacus]|uniref:TlpA disulfide reductase family protein n=1 Tax=Alteribacter aurantiacus TaxID=254410 RepID=UPI00041DBD26|nr:TlpA disulfide reductase family protein [Alteribacter aurantiacus]